MGTREMRGRNGVSALFFFEKRTDSHGMCCSVRCRFGGMGEARVVLRVRGSRTWNNIDCKRAIKTLPKRFTI